MQTSAPKQVTWLIGTIIGVLGILGNFITIPVITGYSFGTANGNANLGVRGLRAHTTSRTPGPGHKGRHP